MENLKPCPFCGGEAVVIQVTSWICNDPAEIKNLYKAGCAKCEIFTGSYKSSIWQGKDGEIHVDANGADDAIVAWNRRVNGEV